ncbi:MAG TPA: dihydroorotate dehydrogenase electron transfer subunit [Syntrophales bacterium]|nr:dihydroorotate dehydrogenase electron transfer subunit [Syntrophales bacterium]
MVLQVPASFMASHPGQFVMVRMEKGGDPFLSRPFSIYSAYSHGSNTYIEILYKVVGKGTEAFSELREGDTLKILGPLGKGFDIPPTGKTAVLIAGGVGIAPLSFLAEYYRKNSSGTDVICYLGAGSSESLAGLEKIEDLCSTVKISTDDGSRGYHGPVTEPFKEDMDRYLDDRTRIYSCGPNPMLKSLQKLLLNRTYACQVSLEERMACGIGACLGCVVKITSDETGEGFMRVCKEGPVFDIHRIHFSAGNGQ